jgi:integrase
VAAWRVALDARGLGPVFINMRITAVRKLAVEAADNGLLAPELANGITRVKGGASKGVRLGNWLTAKQAQSLLNAPDATRIKGLRDRAILAVLFGCGLRRSEVAAMTFKHARQRDRGGQIRATALNEKVCQLIRSYAETAGVAGIAPHDCRRTCAKSRGRWRIRAASDAAGPHASVQTIERISALSRIWWTHRTKGSSWGWLPRESCSDRKTSGVGLGQFGLELNRGQQKGVG